MKCYFGNSSNKVCPNSSHNPENPNYQKELAKDRKAYKHVPKSEDGRGRPKEFTKAQAVERQKKRDKDRPRESKKTYKKKQAPYQFTKKTGGYTLSFE
jgi:hypothetical protein